ncbi:unnamed protein product [Lampetra fluviatilis]
MSRGSLLQLAPFGLGPPPGARSLAARRCSTPNLRQAASALGSVYPVAASPLSPLPRALTARTAFASPLCEPCRPTPSSAPPLGGFGAQKSAPRGGTTTQAKRGRRRASCGASPRTGRGGGVTATPDDAAVTVAGGHARSGPTKRHTGRGEGCGRLKSSGRSEGGEDDARKTLGH